MAKFRQHQVIWIELSPLNGNDNLYPGIVRPLIPRSDKCSPPPRPTSTRCPSSMEKLKPAAPSSSSHISSTSITMSLIPLFPLLNQWSLINLPSSRISNFCWNWITQGQRLKRLAASGPAKTSKTSCTPAKEGST